MIGANHIIRLRPVSLPWHCQMSGDCCRAVGTVLMTPEEQQEILAFISVEKANTLEWTHDETTKFVRLRAHPCPLLLPDNRCSVYPVRPYNCRRWGCFRADVKTEPLEPDHSFLGCANTRDRWYQNKGVRSQLRRMQRHAQKWGKAHGWKKTDTGAT